MATRSPYTVVYVRHRFETSLLQLRVDLPTTIGFVSYSELVAVASLGLVSPRAATDSVTPISPFKRTGDLL